MCGRRHYLGLLSGGSRDHHVVERLLMMNVHNPQTVDSSPVRYPMPYGGPVTPAYFVRKWSALAQGNAWVVRLSGCSSGVVQFELSFIQMSEGMSFSLIQ